MVKRRTGPSPPKQAPNPALTALPIGLKAMPDPERVSPITCHRLSDLEKIGFANLVQHTRAIKLLAVIRPPVVRMHLPGIIEEEITCSRQLFEV